MSDVLERFHKALVEEIRVRRPEYLQRPFTVAEIYQNLVPYGTHRDLIGVEMNGDYEDALTRMLAGEGGYLILESEDALRLLQHELHESHPNVGAYREFAAVDVRLNPKLLPKGDPGPSWVAISHSDEQPSEELPVSEEPHVPSPSPEPAVVKADDSAPPHSEACLWCREELPNKPNLHFCPWCGTDIRMIPCTVCGEEIEPAWRFCIACGNEVDR
ncbi:MAG: zinc ribbon domain-containing protein [Gemmatimonadetes bacterium]|nr:zinc ribbon domain-containing protein [Gemmatimonadota bacterium]